MGDEAAIGWMDRTQGQNHRLTLRFRMPRIARRKKDSAPFATRLVEFTNSESL